MPKKDRVISIDLLRIIAILIVIMTHVHNLSSPGDVSFSEMAVTGACVFFMASGAFIFPVRSTGTEFVKRRLKRVLPPFIIWSVIYVALSYRLGGVVEPTPMTRLKWSLFTPTFGPGWFVLTLIGVYLFAPILSPWVKRASRSSMEAVLALWMLSGLMPVIETLVPINEQVMIFSGYFSFIGYALAGYYLTCWPIHRRAARVRLVFYVVMIALWLGYGYWLYMTFVNGENQAVIFSDLSVNIMAFSVLLFSLVFQVKIHHTWVRHCVEWLSRHVYGVFLCHFAVVEYIVTPLDIPYWEGVALTVAISWTATWLLSLIFPSRFIIKPY